MCSKVNVQAGGNDIIAMQVGECGRVDELDWNPVTFLTALHTCTVAFDALRALRNIYHIISLNYAN